LQIEAPWHDRGMSGITIERLPAEREPGAAIAAPAGACCCCCCCCLHSVGSLVGALTAQPRGIPTDLPPTAVVGAPRGEPKYAANREYWVSLLVICCVIAPAFFLLLWDLRMDGEMILAYALFFPAMQLAASAAALVLLLISKRPGREQRLRHLGSITARSFVGGVIGFVIMLPLFGLL
jgi:hypothetical protein